jgi:Asp-tRNA(Asn)/Glu-tRNA(Gln) amidotransferase A subunit family amidase
MRQSATLASLRRELIRGAISAPELIEHTIRQIEQHNPRINAFIETYFDEARLTALECQKRLQNGSARSLEGLPVTIKDSIDIAGKPTACGSLLNRNSRPAADATCVRLLKSAGAIVIGKTSCPEFLMNYETDNRLIGPTNNPWNLDRTSGGSSGGEAAAIATFCSAGGMGSDGGGSVRFPAHACGIAGLKPTPGRVSAVGHVPPIAHPGGLLGAVGPMARTAQDVDALFAVLAQYDVADPFSVPIEQRPAQMALFKNNRLRVGVMRGWLDVPVQFAMAAAVESAAATLTDLGYVTDEFRPRGIDRAPNVWWFFFGRIHSRVTAKSLEGKEDQLHWTGRELLDKAMSEPEPTVAEILENFALRDRMRSSLLEQMETHRVLLLPACGITAFPHRTRRWQTPKKEIGLFEVMMPLTPFNLFGMPGMVVPFGSDEEGLPCGIQLVGRPYDEELLLRIAMELEEARGAFPTPPGVNFNL